MGRGRSPSDRAWAAGAFFDRGLAASSDAESGLAIDGRTEMPSHRGRMRQTRRHDGLARAADCLRHET